ncbi:MAG: type VI secretion system baseplate subunit TssG [Alphaproteobacteria bacterium]|nr:type VI secretion system baseplate subunit TssG [Alphaproteobacteria bacterium]
MATKSRRSTDALNNKVLRDVVVSQGSEFDFHALVKLLEQFYTENGTPVGEGASPYKEVARFRALVSLEFPQSDVSKAILPDDGNYVPPLVESNFMGLAGLQGPLPTPYTQRVLDATASHNTAMRDFLDIFNHRLLSLLHRVRKSYWVGVSSSFPEHTQIGNVLAAFIGQNSWINEHDLPLRSVLAMALCFWQKPRSADQLRLVLSVFLRTQVHIDVLQGRWQIIPQEDQTMLGTHGRFQKLGQSAVMGRRFWDVTQQFTVVVGPIPFSMYKTLLRGTPSYQAIVHICRAFAGNNKHVRLHILWSHKERQKTRLGAGAALGSTSWLYDSQSVVFDQQTIMTEGVRI